MPSKPTLKTDLPQAMDASQVVARAQEGDLTVLPHLQQLLRDKPEIWQRCGDLAQHARQALLALVAGNNLLLRESIAIKLTELQQALADEAPSPLETLLVQRVSLCWLQVNIADVEASRASSSASQGQQQRSRQDSAQRRYLEAIRAWAAVRKMIGTTSSPAEIVRRLGQVSCTDTTSRSLSPTLGPRSEPN